MQHWGKVTGVALALMMGTGFPGAALGFIIGHLFDQARARRTGRYGNQEERQALFFATTFEVMGRLAKAKGRVTEADIRIASLLMDRMGLQGESRGAAQRAFRAGKADNYPLREKMRQLRGVCFARSDLIRMFLEIQIQTAFVDGALHARERDVLYVIAEELGISRNQFAQFLRMMQGRTQFGGGDQQQRHSAAPRQPTLEDACNVLGVKPGDDAPTIKRAWRKLMSEHHPDKLVAKGLPPQMMEMAKQKAQQIQLAYELIKAQRGFK